MDSTRWEGEGALARLMLSTHRVGHLFGTAIQVHWTFPLVLVVLVLWLLGHWGLSVVHLALAVGLAGVWLGSILGHELGHVFAARACGLPAGYVVLHPLGGLALIGETRHPIHELVVAAAGPLVNAALGLVLVSAYFSLGGPFDAALFFPFAGVSTVAAELRATQPGMFLLYWAAIIQSALCLFNLGVAVHPLDGGRVLLALMWMRSGRHLEALRSSLLASRALGFGMAALGLYLHAGFLVMLGVLVAWMAHVKYRQLPSAAELQAMGEMGLDVAGWEPAPAPRRGWRRPNPLRQLLIRWVARRAIAREERRIDLRQRVDDLLAKISREGGMAGLTDDERRFLHKASKEFSRDEPRAKRSL